MIKYVHWSSCNTAIILVRLMKLEISLKIFETTQISNFMKLRPVGAELFHADRRTVTTKTIVAFRNFSNAPKNYRKISTIFSYL
jgi:hypothetical protein